MCGKSNKLHMICYLRKWNKLRRVTSILILYTCFALCSKLINCWHWSRLFFLDVQKSNTVVSWRCKWSKVALTWHYRIITYFFPIYTWKILKHHFIMLRSIFIQNRDKQIVEVPKISCSSPSQKLVININVNIQ